MREPKYRGFSKETKSWHYGHGWFKTDLTEEYKQEKGIEDSAILYTEGSPIECELKSMGQYTGLKDKNGREIYEGDLVRKQFEDGKIGDFFAVGQVVFGQWYAGFIVQYKYDIYNKLERLSESMDKDGWIVANRDMEVIGNIYEEPQLTQ